MTIPGVLAFAVLLFLLWAGFLRRRPVEPPSAPPPPEPLTFDGVPDKPMGFGYKNLWIAVPATSTEEVAAALGLEEVVPCNWRSGYQAVYSYPGTHIFVTPPLDGWVLAAGWALPGPGNPSALESWQDLMSRLSETFGEAQFFANHRVSSYTAWARYRNGRVERLFAQGDDPLHDLGWQTPEEEELGFRFFEPNSPEAEEEGYWDREDLRSPDESDVMALAERWSLDPSRLGERDLPPSTGLAGRLPRR